jgi:hypothetical protein
MSLDQITRSTTSTTPKESSQQPTFWERISTTTTGAKLLFSTFYCCASNSSDVRSTQEAAIRQPRFHNKSIRHNQIPTISVLLPAHRTTPSNNQFTRAPRLLVWRFSSPALYLNNPLSQWHTRNQHGPALATAGGTAAAATGIEW